MNDILTPPLHGWSRFTFDSQAHISYIDDMPYFLLEEIINSIEENRPFEILFDAEGYSFILSSGDKKVLTYLLVQDDIKSIVLPFSFKDFAEAVINDIKENFEAWKCFPACFEYDKDEYPDLNELLNRTSLALSMLD